MTFKQKIYNEIHNSLREKMHSLQSMARELGEGAENESKSSAGDKHETSRAMVQIEQDAINKQLYEVEEQKVTLERIHFPLDSSQVRRGSLVRTNKGLIFLSIAFGKVIVDGVSVMAISPQSPLGTKLLGLKQYDSISINQVGYTVEDIN